MELGSRLDVRDEVIVCAKCDAPIVDVDELSELKRALSVNRHPVTADPIGGDTDQFVDDTPEIVEYACPSCGSLIDTEVTVDDEPISGRRR